MYFAVAGVGTELPILILGFYCCGIVTPRGAGAHGSPFSWRSGQWGILRRTHCPV